MHSLLGLFPDDVSGLTSAKYPLASTVSTKINTLEIRKPQIHGSPKAGQALGTRNSLMRVGGLPLCRGEEEWALSSCRGGEEGVLLLCRCGEEGDTLYA